MQVADRSAWRLFYLALKDIRMPLFTGISGFVYAMRPICAVADCRSSFWQRFGACSFR